MSDKVLNHSSPLVYIILLNYNGSKDTIECIYSLEKINYRNYKIVILDNSSTDDSENILREKFPHHIFIQTGKNLGFAGGNNVGIKYALDNNADYILLLNNDTVVEPDFLEPLVKYVEEHDEIGIVAGKINYYSKKDRIWSAGGYISEIKGCGYHYGKDEIDHEQYNNKREVSFLTGCMQLIKREIFETVGLYNPDYFLYLEDVDFCYRVCEAGYKLVYIPESKIYHKVSASTGEESPLFLYYFNRNRLLFVSKNIKQSYKRIIFTIFFLTTRIIKMLAERNSAMYIFKGIVDYYKGITGFRKL